MNTDVDRLYVPRKKGGRGLVSATLAIESEWRNLSHYVHHSNDPYIKLVAETFKSFALVGRIISSPFYNIIFSHGQTNPSMVSFCGMFLPR